MEKIIKYEKLVRDKIPEILEKKGIKFIVHSASDEEYKEKLKEKLREEVEEFIKDTNEEELADILEVLEAFSIENGFSKENIKKIQEKKMQERGGFDKKIILEKTIE